MRTDILTPGGRGAYSRAHTAAALRYYKSNGSPAVARLDDCETPRSLATRLAEHSRDWHATHDDQIRAACERAGASAVRKLYRDRVKRRDTYAGLTIVDPVHRERLEREATDALARLAELEPAPATRSRKTATAAPVVKLRKTSKLEPCTRHAGYWQSLPPARRYATAVEGGTSTPCEGGTCTLTPGTDRYTAELAARGPVTLAELNGTAPAAAAELEPAPVTIHAVFVRRNGSVTESGPVCAHLTIHDSRDDVDTGPGAPADDDVTCHRCREILACLSPATPADDMWSPGPHYVDCDDCGTRDYPGESHTCEPRTDAAPVAAVVPLRPDIPAPDTVPAPMPAMTRAARKATRRELAAQLRAAGIRPEGDAWRDACRAAGLPVCEEVNA